MKSLILRFVLLLFAFVSSNARRIKDDKLLLDRSLSIPDPDGYYRLSNHDFICLQRLSACSSNGWSLRFKMRLNPLPITKSERQQLLFSSGAHEAYGDGILMNLVRSKNNSYLELGLKEFHIDQVSYYWHLEVDLETNQWIDMVTTVKKRDIRMDRHHILTVYLDGYLYKETIVENFTEWSVFNYEQLHPTVTVIYGNDTGLSIFERIIYYERVLTEEEIANVPSDIVDLGCVPDDNLLGQYRMTEKFDTWSQCRNECFRQNRKIGLYSPRNKQCRCIQNSNELALPFPSTTKCICSLESLSVINDQNCFRNNQWYMLAVSHSIELIDSGVGLEIQLTDSSFLTYGRLRVQIHESVEIIVSVNNERNLASLTVYGDIEGQDNVGNNSSLSNEMYITTGVMSLSWKHEGLKTIVFRADYRRPVENIVSEYRTVNIDVIFIKTDLPLQYVYFSPDTRDGDAYQRFIVQSFGSVPINCTINYGDGHRQTNGTNRHQFYTTYFTHNYTRVGRYNVTVECSNQKNMKMTNVTRTIIRKNLSDKIILRKELIGSQKASRFQMISRDDYSFSHVNCLQLRNMITDERMKVIWRNNTIEIADDKSLRVGKHLFQLECDSISLQPYIIDVQLAISSLDIIATQTVIQSGQSIDFSIALEPTHDLTIIFDCDSTPRMPLQISYIEKTSNRSRLIVANCTYSKLGQYHPFVSVLNRVSHVNQSMYIRVEETLAPFKVEIEDRPDISQSVLVTIQALERVSFEGYFNFTIISSNPSEKNMTKHEHIQFSASNDFTEQVYINVTTYGRQTLYVSGGNAPFIHTSQVIFTIGTDMITSPQVYIINSMAWINEDIVWIDVQWINGIGFDIEIEFDVEKRVRISYAQLITTLINRTIENDQHGEYWRRVTDRRAQIGFRYTTAGIYKIGATFIQASSKRLSIELKCPTVTVMTRRSIRSNYLCNVEEFHLVSSNALNNVSSSSAVLLLPYSLQHNLASSIACSKDDLVYSFYLLAVQTLTSTYSHRQSPSNQRSKNGFQEEFLSKFCSEHQSKFSFIIRPKSLNYGYYLLHITIHHTDSNHFQHFIQPIEIVRSSDLSTTFDGHQTILNNGDFIVFDFLSTIDVLDRQNLNFTLLCYPESSETHLFTPNGLRLGPIESNLSNSGYNKLIPWINFTLIMQRPELNFYFYEHQCLSHNGRRYPFAINSQTRQMNISEQVLMLNNRTLHFDLIIRHLVDGRMLIARQLINKRMQINFNTSHISILESTISRLDNLVVKNPKQAIELVADLAVQLNEISQNASSELINDTDIKMKNEQMSPMRSKMLSSIDIILDAVSDIKTLEKTIRATYAVTVNSDQMPVNNQEKAVDLIEKMSSKLRNLTWSDDPMTIIEQTSALMDVGNNVLHAGSIIVLKEKDNDPIGIIKSLDWDVKETELHEYDHRIRYAPTKFYNDCDYCQSQPEERWNSYREDLEEENRLIIETRQRVARMAKRCMQGFLLIADRLASLLSNNEIQTIESKSMIMIFTKIPPDGRSSLSTGNTTICLPDLFHLNLSSSSIIITKALETKENPFMSIDGKSNVQGRLMTIVLSHINGSEISVNDSRKPIVIRLARPIDQYPKYQKYTLLGTSLRYHRVYLPKSEMSLFVHLSPVESPLDTYVIYVSYGINESTVEQPTELKFDFVFLLPNTTKNSSSIENRDEVQYTIFMPPTLHRGNGTYIFGVKSIQSISDSNITANSSYIIGMYVSICQYWNEEKYVWNRDGCEVGSQTTLKSTECLCNHLTTFGSDFYVPPNSIDFKTVFAKFRKLHENAAVFSTVITLLGVYLIAAIWTRRTDQRDLIKWTALPLVDNLPIDIYHYLITVHTGFGKESGTTSNISFVISGESADSGVRKLTDGKIKEFQAGSVRNFVLSVELPLGPLLYLRVWHDNSGHKTKASWYLNMINVMDLQTGEKNYFICDNWLAVEKGHGVIDRIVPVASMKELKSFTHLFTQSVKKKLSDGHLWFSVFSRPARSNFTRLQRLSCCISLLFCTMISNAMFYRQDVQTTPNKAGVVMKIGPIQFTFTQLWISFIGTLVVLPVNLIIVTLFRKAKYSQKMLISNHGKQTQRHRHSVCDEILQDSKPFSKVRNGWNTFKSKVSNYKRMKEIPLVEDKTRTFPHWTVYIAWALVMLSTLTCSFFIILYSMEWGAQRANEWLITMMLSFGQSILVIDPLKVFLVTAILSFLIRHPYDDETLDFDDPFTEALITKTNETNEDDFTHYNHVNAKEIARQRRVRLFELKPIDSSKMARARQKRLNEIKMGEIFHEFVVYTIFLIVLLFLSYQARDTNSNRLYISTKKLFITNNFQEINSIQNLWHYCQDDLLKGLYAQEWYNGKNLTWRDKLMIGNRELIRVGAARFRQLRVKNQSCRVHRRVRHIMKHCRNDYNWFDDDTKDYEPGWTSIVNKTDAITNVMNGTRCKKPWCYQNSVRTKSGPLSAIYSTYKGGGYLISLARSFDKTRSMLADLYSQHWLDQFTRALLIEFSLYSANVNLFVAVTLSIEMTSMGSTIQDYKIKIFRLYDHLGGYAILVFTGEFLFVLFTAYALIHEAILIIKERRNYFCKFWNLHAFVTCVFSITAIGMYGTKKTLTRLAIRSLRKSEMGEFVNFNAIASFDEVYSYIVGLITFLTMLKLLKLLRFIRRIGMLSNTLRYARGDLGSFAFVFAIVMLAYAQMGFALLGRSIKNFKSFSTSLTTCFRMMLGGIKAPEIVAVGGVYGTLYFVSFIFLVCIALLAIFLTILNDSFARVKRELAASNEHDQMMTFMWSTFRKVAGLDKNCNEKTKVPVICLNSLSNTGEAPLAAVDNEVF